MILINKMQTKKKELKTSRSKKSRISIKSRNKEEGKSIKPNKSSNDMYIKNNNNKDIYGD